MDEITRRQKEHYENFEDLDSDSYDLGYGAYSKYENELVMARRNDIAYRAKHQARSLDLACGTGNLTANITEDSDFTIGGDFCFKWILKAKKKFGNRDDIKFVCMDAQNLPFNGSTFDIVYCYNAFYHIHDRKKAISEISRVLQSGGEFRFEAYNIFHPFVIIRYIVNFFAPRERVLTFGSSLWMLKRNLRENGMKVVRVSVFSRIEATETIRKEVPAWLFAKLYLLRKTRSWWIPPMRYFIHAKKI